MPRLGASIAKALPDAFKIPRFATDPDSPLIYSGSMLQMSDVHMLPVQKKEQTKIGKDGIKLYGAFGSYAVMQSLVVLPSENAYQFLWTHTRDLLVWIGGVAPKDSLDSLLSVFEKTGFGAARLSGKQIHTIVTLEDLVSKVREGELTSGLKVDAVSTELISIEGDASLADALQLMFKGRVRRLFLDEEPGRFISDRTILALLFSPYMLKLAKETPSKWLDLTVRDIPRKEAERIQSGASLMEAAKRMGQWPDDCLLTDRSRVATRWDLVVKSWKKDLRFVSTDQLALQEETPKHSLQKEPVH